MNKLTDVVVEEFEGVRSEIRGEMNSREFNLI
jgi:hypothetical protein